MSRILVAYFSASGETKKLAETIASALKTDIREIQPAVPYTDADLNWNNAKSRSSVEMRDRSSRPEMASSFDVSGYDTVLVGFPILWGEAPRIIETFLESGDFSGRTIVPFATSGGSGMGRSVDILKQSIPGAAVRNGRVMSSGDSSKAVLRWAESLGIG